ncbi:unnamed protein product [Prorocentrum cordatum]|uniref:Uncharacterized protein n=1 Tax=Prorocentrum cordatum TaxID=2364126 RepID=A0ABN9YCN8_9DINO|nr:unnamed protein product [Polarella glacialis]
MPARSKKAQTTKQNNCRDRKRAASIAKWLKKPWVKEHLRRGLEVHLQKVRNNVKTLKQQKADLQKEVAAKKKDNFYLRRDVFLHTAFDRVKSKNDALHNQLAEARGERDAAKRTARTALAKGKREGEEAAWEKANKELCSLQTALSKAKNRCISTEKSRFMLNASRAQREAYHELAKRPKGRGASLRDGCFGTQ